MRKTPKLDIFGGAMMLGVEYARSAPDQFSYRLILLDPNASAL
ncbi:MAG TPA: hypothetical protein VMX56_03225 [Anaerolineales bacterium]|nr:hypothetical protein [Anaerolineales bacterium]